MPDDQILEQVKLLYLGGASGPQIAVQFGKSTTTIYNWLQLKGVQIRSNVENKRIYCIDETAFDTLSPEVEYWLGWTMADGNVHHPTNSRSALVQYTVRQKDEAHLEKLRAFLGANYPIRRQKTTTGVQSGLFISSEALAASLARYGIVERKSFVAEAKGEIVESRHFWRGVIDGNGSIGLNKAWKKPHLKIGIQLVGSKALVGQFADYMGGLIGNTPPVAKHKMIWQAGASSRPGGRVVWELYHGDDIVALDRKLEKAQSIMIYYKLMLASD